MRAIPQSTIRMASLDGTALPCDNLGHQGQIPISNHFQTYETHDLKCFEHEIDFFNQTPIPQCNQSAPNQSCFHQPEYLFESTSGFHLLRPDFRQLERVPKSAPNTHPEIPLNEPMAPQTVTPTQAFSFAASATLPFSCVESPPKLFTPETQPSPISMPLDIRFGAGTPSSLLFEEQSEYDKKDHLSSLDSVSSSSQQHHPGSDWQPGKQPTGSNLNQEDVRSVIKQGQFKCTTPKCNRSFKRQEHLKRHMKNHSKEKRYVCWVPGCYRAFSRGDNLNAHCTKTHSKPGGRNRYVASLDKTSPDYNPNFRGQLTSDGRPVHVNGVEKKSSIVNTIASTPGIDRCDDHPLPTQSNFA